MCRRGTRTRSAMRPAPHQGTVLIMPAWQPGAYLGIKTVTIFPGNSQRGLPGLHSTYMLYDAAQRRPAGADRWQRDHLASHRGGVGAGGFVPGDGDAGTCWWSALAGSAACCRRPTVPCGRSSASRCGTAMPPTPRPWPKACASRASTRRPAPISPPLPPRADIVSCATLATEPVVHGAWLRADSHLDLIGSFTPAMREADDACFAGATQLYVDTRRGHCKRAASCSGRCHAASSLLAISQARWPICAAGHGAGTRHAGRAHRFQVGRHRTRRPGGCGVGVRVHPLPARARDVREVIGRKLLKGALRAAPRTRESQSGTPGNAKIPAPTVTTRESWLGQP